MSIHLNANNYMPDTLTRIELIRIIHIIKLR